MFKYFYKFTLGCGVDIYGLNFRFWGSRKSGQEIYFGKGENGYSYGKNEDEKGKNTKLSISF